MARKKPASKKKTTEDSAGKIIRAVTKRPHGEATKKERKTLRKWVDR